MLISTLKWPLLATIAPSFMAAKASLVDHVLVAGGGDDEVGERGGLTIVITR